MHRMFWELRSVTNGIKDEFQGWHKFRQSNWQVASVVRFCWHVFNPHTLFVSGLYLLIKALETGRLPIIFAALFAGTICGAAAPWYGLRRLACKLDVVRAQRSGETRLSTRLLMPFFGSPLGMKCRLSDSTQPTLLARLAHTSLTPLPLPPAHRLQKLPLFSGPSFGPELHTCDFTHRAFARIPF